MRNNPKYDLTISFAGEDRGFVEPLADALVVKGLKIFYDKYEEEDLWGKDLYTHLTTVYRDEAKFCLMVISESYAKKQWTNHERKAAQARSFRENSEYILPLILDATEIDGVLDTTGYIVAKNRTLESLVDLVVLKIVNYNKKNGIEETIVRVEDAFRLEKFGPKNGPTIKDKDMQTECPTCSTVQYLSDSTISLQGSDTIYTCKQGCQIIALIGKPGLVPWDGRGYRIGSYVLRNTRDIFITVKLGGPKVLIPASPSSLMTKRPT